jgi:hypothetical protein
MTDSSSEVTEERSRPLVGAIRWDAWSGGEVTAQVERTLGPEKYHDRLPWFAEVLDAQTVRIAGDSPEIMAREIACAAEAGVDYWAFLLYPEEMSMSAALTRYLASPERRRVDFCLILHNAFGVCEAEWPRERDRAIALLQEPGYQTVLGNRPLVFAFQVQFQGAFPLDRFAEFRQAADQAGLDPYYVYMGWDPAGDFAAQAPLGFDAVSAYAMGSAHATFAELVDAVEAGYWQRAAQAQVPYVPMVTTGWNKDPRKDHPVSWELGQDYHTQQGFPAVATPQEIAAHLARALTFVQEHPAECAANAVILYAWNEYDEGGWLAPTWTPAGRPNAGRLEAVRDVLVTAQI